MRRKKKVEDPSASSVASSSVENSGKKTQASAVRTSAQNTAIQSAPPTSYSSSSVPAPKRKRKRKSRFDERPPDSDISAVMPQPKEDPLGSISDPLVRSKLQLTGELAAHPTKRKHHISDYLPKEELMKFLAKSKGLAAPVEKKNTITSENKGFNLLQKMGWKEGSGLGKGGVGIKAPVQARGNAGGAGIGHQKPTDVNEKDDIFTQYKKRMALAYRYRPNPLGNPRTPYWDDDSMNKGATQKL
mmetsp:Transcript_28221/g.44946  ORF Transcript_28221/g.44946 Transcript_28221/m.44946 type:complete len:244 (-) Transcript_28221:96-827(-)